MIIDKLFAYKGNMKDEALLIFVSLQMVFCGIFFNFAPSKHNCIFKN